MMAAALVLMVQLRFVLVERGSGRLDGDASRLLEGVDPFLEPHPGKEPVLVEEEPPVAHESSPPAVLLDEVDAGIGSHLIGREAYLAAKRADAAAALAAGGVPSGAFGGASPAHAEGGGGGGEPKKYSKNHKVEKSIPAASSIKAFHDHEDAGPPLNVSSFHLPALEETWPYVLHCTGDRVVYCGFSCSVG